MVFLKNIEAKGFKSFAEKTRIEFNEGLTAVVGPNGSGKSNIIDAVRFVLGETSARSIRGSKMEDVIFNGTVKRDKDNSARVTLSLDNSDQKISIDDDTVKVTRILYRSGESEYYLNGSRVKLKDITDLFMDKGIGKSAYNIISQGEVEQILRAKPEERRNIIEEAAGVMKYKTRKRESERKLSDTKVNLDRVNDIIHELEERNNRLMVESKIATEYLALMEEMKTSDIEVTLYDIDNHLKEEEKFTKEYNDTERMLEDRKHHVNLLDVEVENLRDKREQLTLKERELNKEIVEKTRALEIVNGKIALFEERKSSRGQLSMDLKIEKEKYEARLLELEKELKDKNEFLTSIKNEKDSIKERIKTTRTNIDRLTSEDTVSIEDLKDKYYQLMVEKTNLENAQQNEDESKSRLKSSLNEKRQKVTTLKSELDQIASQLSEIKEEKSETVKALNEARNLYRDTKKKYDEKINEYDYLNENYQKAETLINQESSRLDVLINMQENFQGYYPGVRAILKNKKRLEGIVGAVGELIQIDEKYVVALDTALGAQSQNVVVQNDRDAKRAIDFLKREKHGFATFLPLSTIVSRTLPSDVIQRLSKTNVNHEILSDLVKVEKGAERLVNHLVQTTIIVGNLDDGTKLAKEISYRARIVTLDGDTITPGGAMSGGSRTRQNSVLKMKQDVNELQKKLSNYRKSTEELKDKLSKVKETISMLTVELKKQEELGTKKSQLNDEQERELEKLTYVHELKKETYDALLFEIDEIVETRGEIDYQEKIEEKEQEILKLSDEIALLSDKQTNQEERLISEKEDLHVLRRDLSQLDTKENYELDALNTLQDSLVELEENLSSINTRIDMTENDNLELDIDSLNSEQSNLTEVLSKLKDEITVITDELTEINEVYKENITLRQNHLEDIERAQILLRELHGNREKISTQLNQKVDYLSETYALTYERAKELYNDFTDIEMKRQRIQLNKRSIEELGNVNVGAIEEYKTVNERYLYLKEQESDLLEARNTLLSVIDEMDKEVSERFKETYEQVSEAFSQVFEEMFGGGFAELKLTDESDYLNSGLEIIAQPPGKKLTQMSLMSGGERALTAISLLFSILKVKYSPFIILDEVEAALDESNVLRYADYLKKLSEDTQFIVITHRKGTMEKSDRLFGVTMQERGVSELISVDLKTYVEPERKEV